MSPVDYTSKTIESDGAQTSGSTSTLIPAHRWEEIRQRESKKSTLRMYTITFVVVVLALVVPAALLVGGFFLKATFGY